MPRTTYTTEEELKEYMLAELAEVAEECEWLTIAAPAYQIAVNAVLTEAQIDTVDLIASARLELLARVEIWRRVVKFFATATNWNADGMSISDKALFDQASKILESELAAATQAGYYQAAQTELRSTRVRANFTF